MSNIYNISSRFHKPKDNEKFVLTSEIINNYVSTLKDVNASSSSLSFEDLEVAVGVAAFYSQRMKERIEFLEREIKNNEYRMEDDLR